MGFRYLGGVVLLGMSLTLGACSGEKAPEKKAEAPKAQPSSGSKLITNQNTGPLNMPLIESSRDVVQDYNKRFGASQEELNKVGK